jgi:hypothetical protein
LIVHDGPREGDTGKLQAAFREPTSQNNLCGFPPAPLNPRLRGTAEL